MKDRNKESPETALSEHGFVAGISQELRRPLTVLLGYLEMLLPQAEDETAQALKHMHVQARQIQAMLDDLLELSGIAETKEAEHDQFVDVPAIVTQLKEQAEELSSGHHELEFRIDSELHLKGNARNIESAFRNLIVNAVRYTPSGGTIQVTWDMSGSGAEFVVEDNGIGIAAEDIPRLTRRFFRAESDPVRNTEGAGLGLSIVRQVVEAHQANLHIESEPGKGSRFSCTFPDERLLENSFRVAQAAGK